MTEHLHDYCFGGGRYCRPLPPCPPLEQWVAPEPPVARPRRCWCGGEDGEHEADAHAEEGVW